MATSTLTAFRSALAAAIVSQLSTDAVTGVTVFEFPPGDAATDSDFVFIGTIRTSQTHLAFGGSRDEDLDAEIVVYVMKPGAGDTVAASAEDRAELIFASIENTLRTDATATASVFHAQITGTESVNGVTEAGRFCQLTVDIEAGSHI